MQPLTLPHFHVSSGCRDHIRTVLIQLHFQLGSVLLLTAQMSAGNAMSLSGVPQQTDTTLEHLFSSAETQFYHIQQEETRRNKTE